LARYLIDHTIELTTPCRRSKGCPLPPHTAARLLMEQAVRPVVEQAFGHEGIDREVKE
jgi:non-canonical (house-cleaning) NTP pyrophosphatase